MLLASDLGSKMLIPKACKSARKDLQSSYPLRILHTGIISARKLQLAIAAIRHWRGTSVGLKTCWNRRWRRVMLLYRILLIRTVTNLYHVICFDSPRERWVINIAKNILCVGVYMKTYHLTILLKVWVVITMLQVLDIWEALPIQVFKSHTIRNFSPLQVSFDFSSLGTSYSKVFWRCYFLLT